MNDDEDAYLDMFDGYDDGPWRPRWANPNYGDQRGSMNDHWQSWQHKAKTIATIEVFDIDDEQKIVARKEVDEYNSYYWDLITKHWGDPVNGIIRIPSTAVKEYQRERVDFNACTFDATKSFLSKMLGVGLDYDDEQWLRHHQFSLAEGISDKKLPTALHQLVEVYGIGVSRIRYRRGLFLLDDEEQIRWMSLLGCNPLAVADHNTTNAEAAEVMQMPLEILEQDFRVEFHDEPLRPSVIGEKGGSSIGAAGNFYSPGHARFLGPRAREYSDWTISIQFERLERIKYLAPVVLPEYQTRAGEKTFLLMDVLRPDGKDLNHRDNWFSTKSDNDKKKDDKPPKQKGGNGHTQHSGIFLPGTQRPHRVVENNSGQSMIKCFKCKAWYHFTLIESNVDLCSSCWERAWQGVRCPYKEKCGLLLSGHNAPLFLGMENGTSPILYCSSCFGRLAPPMNDEELYVIFSSPTCRKAEGTDVKGKRKEADLDTEILS